jgi:tripartite-type tricarboxylate transporter receptor subunit TctC
MFAKLAAIGLVLLGTVSAGAAEYPSRPVQLVVPWAAGGVLDSVTRTLQPPLTQALGQPVIIENRTGANGTLGTAYAARSAADGYTVLMTIESHVINQAIYRKLPFDAFLDFEAIALIGGGPILLIANKEARMDSVADVIRIAKENPGSISYGSIGAGSQHHLLGLLLSRKAGVELTHIPYRGGGPAMSDLIAGQIPLMFLSVSGVLPLLETGKIKALAVFAAERHPKLANVPTIGESGFPGIEAAVWFGALVPKGTPAPIRARLISAFQRAAAAPPVQEQFERLGLQSKVAVGDDFRAIMQRDFEKYSDVGSSLNLVPN